MATAKTILIVEDDGDFAESLSTALTLKMHSVEIASTGFEALDKVQQKTFDICVLDIKMPGMSGLECLAKIKPLLPENTRYIIMTGFRDSETLQQAAQSAAEQVLLKPFSIFEFLRLVETTN